MTTLPSRLSTGVLLRIGSVPVASPYAVFRASDLVWAAAPRAVPAFGSRSIPAGRARPRKRLAPVAVIQGELFALQPLGRPMA